MPISPTLYSLLRKLQDTSNYDTNSDGSMDLSQNNSIDDLANSAELQAELAGTTEMGNSLASRAELPVPYAKANPMYAKPQGMAESLHARAELPDEPVPARAPASGPLKMITPKQETSGNVPYQELEYNSLDRLKAAQDATMNNQLNVNLLNAGQTINEALNRTKFNRDVNKSLEATAAQPIEFYKQNEAGQKSDLDILGQMYKNSTAQHLRDPNSDISKASRALFGQMGIHLDDNTSAMDIEQADNLSRLLGIKESIAARKESARLANEAKKDKQNDKQNELDIKHITRLQESYNKAVQDAQKGLDSVEGAKALLMTKNPITDAASATQLARLSGQVGVLTDRDVAPYEGGRGGVAARIEQAIQQRLDGTLTDTNRKFMSEMINKMESAHKRNLERHAVELSKQGATRLKKTPAEIHEHLRPGIPYAEQAVEQLQVSPKEVKRRTQDGRIAVFDDNTKQFLRYEE